MRIAACTMAHNEAMFLPIWSRYYGTRVGHDATFVIDHGSTDGSIAGLPRSTNVIRLPRSCMDEYARLAFVQHFVNGLLHYFDAVLWGDTDEIVIPDPAIFANLSEFCAQVSGVGAPTGVNVFQATDREASLDTSRPVLGQRRFCRFRSDFCKPIIVRSAVTWTPGFHFATEKPIIASDAILFHLKSVDQAASLIRLARTRRTDEWHASNVQDGLSRHHRITDAEHLLDCFEDPLAILQRSSDLSFDFGPDIRRLEAGTIPRNGVYEHSAFSGRVAEIPERFFGLV